MRRAIDQSQHATAAAADGGAFFQLFGRKGTHRQSLLRRLVDISTKKTDGEFPCRQPIRSLSSVTEERYLRLSVEATDKFRSQSGPVVQNQYLSRHSHPRIQAEKFPLPLRLQ